MIGSVLAAWAVLVSGLGVMRKGFPVSRAGEIAVGAITVSLVVCAIGAAVIGALSEESEEPENGGHDEAALILPR